MTEINVGQVWQEVDPRQERFVRVVGFRGELSGLLGPDAKPLPEFIEIETVTREQAEQPWTRVRGTRVNIASSARFSGKRGGYKLIEESPR